MTRAAIGAAVALLAAGCNKASEPVTAAPEFSDSVRALLPELPDAGGTVSAAPGPALVAMSAEALTLNGASIADVTDGWFHRATLQPAGKLNVLVPLRMGLDRPAGTAPLLLAIAGQHRFEAMVTIMVTASRRPAEYRNFHLLGRAGDQVVAIPFQLPDNPGADAGDLVVWVDDKQAMVFSMSQGGMAEPLVRTARAADGSYDREAIASALRENAGPVPPAGSQRRITLIANGAVELGALMPLMAAIRGPDGSLFGDILLSTGLG